MVKGRFGSREMEMEEWDEDSDVEMRGLRQSNAAFPDLFFLLGGG